MRRFLILSSIFIGGLWLGLAACGDAGNEDKPLSREDLRRRALRDLLEGVARPELTALVERATAFSREAAAFRDQMEPSSADTARLRELQESWRELRGDWRRNEIWMIGPIADALWPERLDADVDVEALRRAQESLDEQMRRGEIGKRVAELGAGAKSLMAQARLLFAEEGGPDLQGRALLAATAAENAALIAMMCDPWLSDDGALARAFREPGRGALYESSKEAVDALVQQAVKLAMNYRDRDLAPMVGATARGKVRELPADFDAFGQHRADLVESYLGLQQLYLARHAGEDGRGLETLVEPRSEAVARVARVAFARAVAAMAALPQPIMSEGEAASKARRDAYEAATLVKAQLGTSIVALLETSLGFSLADGD
jgi:predicted lipoprotein